MNILDLFKHRGFCQQITHEEELYEREKSGALCAYVGFDPTAPSLHVGHLIPLMGLAWMQRNGHRAIALMGGGTAMIGDPSGKTEMRKMLTEQNIADNISAMKQQFARFIAFEDDKAILVNNADWLLSLNYIDFLRDIGRHFSVNRMLSFETYKARLETGLSFLEFNYQLLQAYDFLELHKRFNCELQLGGDDQWANILAGVDLIRRKAQKPAYGWTYPLLTTASGKKMGKTEKGAVWLDPNLTSPYDYYQYWVNIEDADVKKCLCFFTFLPMEEVEELAKLEGADIRQAKEKLALEATTIAHGSQEAAKAQKAAKTLFGGSKDNLADIPSTEIASAELQAGLDLFTAFQQCGLCKSKGEARRLLQQGGIYVNDERINDEEMALTPEHLVDGGILLRAGKKRYHRLLVSGA